MLFLSSDVFCVCVFSKFTFPKQKISNSNRLSNKLYPDQTKHSVWPGADPNCLQRLSS